MKKLKETLMADVLSADKMKIFADKTADNSNLSDTLKFYDEIYEILSYVIGATDGAFPITYLKDNLNLKKDPDDYIGGLIEINEKYRDYWMDNLAVLTFNNFYPNALMHILYKERAKLLNTNPSNFREVFSLAMLLYYNFKTDKVFEKQTQILKMFINATYGILGSTKTIYGSTDIDLAASVMNKTRSIMISLVSEFNGHFVYADTDMIIFAFIDEIENRLINMLCSPKMNDMPYELEKGQSGIFLGKKKYILSPTKIENIKVKGLRYR